jgi:hypothetical protein
LSAHVSDVFPKVLKLSSEVSECKPLDVGAEPVVLSVPALDRPDRYYVVQVRGLHSSCTSQLNLSAFYGIGAVRKGLCSPC